MLIAPAILLFAQLAAAPTGAVRYDGICEYPAELRERARAGELVSGSLVECNQVTIAPEQISFGLRSWETRTRFNGTFEGNRMTVTSVTQPNGREWRVRGVCDLSYISGKLSNVACSVYADHATLVANFRVSTINNAR